MPVMDGVEATRAIVAENLSSVLILTTFDHDDHLFGALAAGAAGFLLKSAEPREITAAVRRVAAGDQVISPAVTARVVAAALAGGPPVATAGREAALARLTGREAQVLGCLGDGLSNHAISRTLGISETTVKTHVSRVLATLSLSSRVQAALFISADRDYTN
ncbi:response regulator transcription factor [Paeniglutamicibacter cryotolerans]|uniref:DNA-binding NarL/FixJ family response regulator n=1 Tax=Paeniglutamicibacter cryotolerans TaxID=670079 RepID=A0A839QV49_9MICC|nr:response regulator transcription factor [Paeniglutamicibacter cryotolerans]MBB2995871.1 DNA-binding NarL/FixJ family response regulator [Paeniglutamicibacter cryotolerans]